MLKMLNHYYRVLATGFCFSVFGIGALSLVTFIFPVITYLIPDSRIKSLMIRTSIKTSFKLFVGLMTIAGLITVKTKNLSTIKQTRGKVIVANHPSLIDVVILISILPQSDCIVKKALGDNFFMKNVIKSAYILASDNLESVFADCKKSLADGNNLIIFPEGTRTVPGKKSKLSRGAAQIALKTHADILPVHISCTPPGLLKNQKWYHVADRPLAFIFEPKPLIHTSEYALSEQNHFTAKEVTETIGKVLLIDT